jgi:LAO/AO transport system kinase
VGASAYQAALLCEAAGYAPVLVETIGMGQGELGILEVSDVTMLLVQPGGGDELQAMKRGILEHADLIVVTKADGALLNAAKQAQSEIQAVQQWFSAQTSKPRPVLYASAVESTGVDAAELAVKQRVAEQLDSGELTLARGTRQRARFARVLKSQLYQRFVEGPAAAQRLPQLMDRVERGELVAEEAVEELLRPA